MEDIDLSTCIDIEEEIEVEKKNIDQEWRCECGGVYELTFDVMCCKDCANVTMINKSNNNKIISKNEKLDMSNNKLSVKKVYGRSSTSIVLYPSYNKESKMNNIKNDFKNLQTSSNKIDMKIITYATELYEKLIILNDLVKKKDKKKEIQIGCIYISYIYHKEPRTKLELSHHFGLEETPISTGLKNIDIIANTYNVEIPEYNNKTLVPLFVGRYLKIMGIDADLNKLSIFVANNKPLSKSANPENIAGGITYFYADIKKEKFNLDEFIKETKLTKKSVKDSKKRIMDHYLNKNSPYNIMVRYL